MKNKLFLVFLMMVLLACAPVQAVTPNVQSTAVAIAQTGIVLTQTAVPTVTLTPSPAPISTPTIFVTPTPVLYSPTVVSPFEADHEAIKKVIASYFDKLYYMHSSFDVDGLGDSVSTSEEAAGFQKTELRKRAVDIVWARLNFLRYASYSYMLDYSEIVVFDSGQRARANFTEGNAVVYELSKSGIVSQMSGIKHIMMLRKEQDGWKIIYDVHDELPRRSLYAPTPFPKDVLSGLDKQLINLSQGKVPLGLPQKGKIFIPSDPVQLERWKEYETALAQKLLPQYPRNTVSCEWELTEKLEQKINVWAVCMTTVTSANVGNYYFPAASVPAVINLDASGAVQSVDIPKYGNGYLSDYGKLFPNGAWKTFPNVTAMEERLHWRRTHPAEPPLVVVNATTTPTPSP